MENYRLEKGGGGFFRSLRDILRSELDKRRRHPSVLFADIGVLVIAALFSRCHLIFGARPLALGILALLPHRVFIAALGAVVGGFTLGAVGGVYAIIYLLLVALRIIVSGATASGSIFGESLTLRVCEAAIGGFFAAAYQVLLAGISVSSVLFGITMVLAPPVITFALSGIFDTGIRFGDFFIGDAELLSTKGKAERERYSLIFFQCSTALLSLILALSLSELDIFGFSLSYIYTAAVTLFVARRFGALRAAVTGFVSALPVSATASVSFALAGLGSGALFTLGVGWGIGAGALLSLAWSAYTGGGIGILSVIPEYAVGAAISAPLIRRPLARSGVAKPEANANDAGEMVGAMSLAYKTRSQGALDSLESALISISRAARTFLGESDGMTGISQDGYEDYALISRLISEARQREERERCLDAQLSDSLSLEFAKNGFPGGVIKAFGDRKKHIIAAGEDPDGNLITAPRIREFIENIADVRLGESEYFRRGRTVLLETEARRRFSVESASATIGGSSGEVSGDAAITFESRDDYFYSVISDGMGSGELARETAEFSLKFLSSALDFGGFCDTAMHLLNHILLKRGEECSATVDLFELDLLRGDAIFIKSGAAPSYVKRDSSIFRIRSETAPIGLMRSIDSERVRVEIKEGDIIVMLSDGISAAPEDAPWLLELLSEPPRSSMKEYAEYILSAAVKNSRTGDDMTVTVARIKAPNDKK